MFVPSNMSQDNNDDVESLSTCSEDDAAQDMTVLEQSIERRPTAPPAYEPGVMTVHVEGRVGTISVPATQHKFPGPALGMSHTST